MTCSDCKHCEEFTSIDCKTHLIIGDLVISLFDITKDEKKQNLTKSQIIELEKKEDQRINKEGFAECIESMKDLLATYCKRFEKLELDKEV